MSVASFQLSTLVLSIYYVGGTMLNLKKKIYDYLCNAKEHKIKICFAVITMLILYIISSVSLYSGINKQFIIYSALCFLIGVFIALPRIKVWYINLLMLIIYLLFVPKKMFERMELPTHTMERIQPGVYLANIVIIIFIFSICLLVFQRVRFALGIGCTILLVLFLVNYIVVSARGTSITINDIFAVKTAMQVVGGYRFALSPEAWYSILYFLFFVFWGFWIDIPGKKLIYHLCISAVGIVGIGSFVYFWNSSGYLEKYGLRGFYWNMADNHQLNGFLLSFGLSVREGSMDKPNGYSEDRLNKIVQKAELNYSAGQVETDIKPNIIFIMNEAWSDLSVLGEMETTEEYMPFVNSMEENTVKGNLHVGILGGLTANTEFEVLTGDSLTFLAPGAIPYQLQVNHDIYALPRILKEQGYETYAMHPSSGNAWNRDNVYEYFGFDEFIDVEKFQTEYLYERHFISDKCNYNEIIWQYEHRDTTKPWFLFDVTIQNHGDYYGGIDMPIKVNSFGENNATGYLKDVETYLNLIKISDDAFKDLIEYFSNVSEPTIICMFGDHQPKLGENFYQSIMADEALNENEKNAKKYITQYVIWSNFDLQDKEYGDISANYLGPVVLEYAGLQLPSYYKQLINLMNEYPIISSYTINDIQNENEIKEYKMMQYHHLIDKDCNKKYFLSD